MFQPVYVRVDKKIPRIEDWGSTDRLSSDCLWVNLIEKAYAMSGLHESHRDVVNLPADPAVRAQSGANRAPPREEPERSRQ